MPKPTASAVPDDLLAAARKMVEAADAAKPKTIAPPEFEGEIEVHILSTGGVQFEPDGRRYFRGETTTITPERVTNVLWTNLHGDNTFDAALARGKGFAEGPWPSWRPVWTFGSEEWSEQRREARETAYALLDADKRDAALADLKRVYGDVKGAPSARDYEAWYESQYARRRDWETAHAQSIASAGSAR